MQLKTTLGSLSPSCRTVNASGNRAPSAPPIGATQAHRAQEGHIIMIYRFTALPLLCLLLFALTACVGGATLDAGPSAGERCSEGLIGQSCRVYAPTEAGAERECGEGAFCDNPAGDEGDGCIGICREVGNECSTHSDCDGGDEDLAWCNHGHCEPTCC